MLDSALWLLTMTAVVLLVPAFAALLGVERHRHLAPSEDTSRRVRLVVAATLVGLAALGVSALLDAEPLTAAVVAVVLAGSVLAWAQMSSTWAVRGVVMWALLVTGAVAFLAWLVQQMVASEMDVAQLVVAAAAGLLLVLVLSRGQRYVRESIGAHAGLESGSGRAPLPVLRPLGTLVALLAAGGVVVAVAEDGPGTQGSGPQAGASGTGAVTEGSPSGGTASSGPSSAPTPTFGLAPGGPVAPSAVDAGLVAATTAPYGGIRATTAGLAPSAPVGVPVASNHGRADGGSVSSSAPGGQSAQPGAGGAKPTRPTAARPGTGKGGSGSGSGTGNGSGSGSGSGPGGSGGTSSGGTGTGAGGTGAGGTGSGGTGSGGTGSGGTGSGGTGAGGTGSGGTGAGGTGSGGTGSGGTGGDPNAGTPDPPVVVAVRTPGYAKPKPHRPIDAPSPGHGRLNNHLDEPSPVPSTTMLYAPPPTLLPIPAPTPMLPSLSLLATLQPEPAKTPGWAKEKPGRSKILP